MKAEKRQFLSRAEVEGWRPEWKEWVLLESKRRFALHSLIFRHHFADDKMEL